MLKMLIDEGIASGFVKPLQRKSLSTAEIKQEYLQKADNFNDTKQFTSEIQIKNTVGDGLQTLFAYVEKDTFIATESIVIMPTKYNCSVQFEDELDLSSNYLMLIPGFDGHHKIFTSLCENVKMQALTLQLGPDLTCESIRSIAEEILMNTKQRFKFQSKFFLLGYSFGINVALEMAYLLEKEGRKGVVYCLDSSPDALRTQIRTYGKNRSSLNLQNAILTHFYKLMTESDDIDMEEDLEKLDKTHRIEIEGINMKELDNKLLKIKIDFCIARFKKTVNLSHEYMKLILETACRRIELSQEYEPQFKLKSKLILIRCNDTSITAAVNEDYGLTKYADDLITVHDIKSDHKSILHDPKVANIINKYLDKKTLGEFNLKNLCETYLLHTD